MNHADCMNMMSAQGMGWMMGSMWVTSILLLLALTLGNAALIKYLFFSGRQNTKEP